LCYYDENEIYVSIDEINDKYYNKLIKQSNYTEDEIEDIFLKEINLQVLTKINMHY
jgi:hypothetical protein